MLYYVKQGNCVERIVGECCSCQRREDVAEAMLVSCCGGGGGVRLYTGNLPAKTSHPAEKPPAPAADVE
jgi:hypothetical protein